MAEEVKRPRGRPRKDVLATLPVTTEVKGDDWSNVAIGLGQAQDRTQYTTYNKATILDDATLFQMYLGDGLASRIIDIVADDMTREWIYIKDAKTRKIIAPELERLNAELGFNTSLKWQRLYSGSIILMGIMDGNAVDQPLNEAKIRNIEYLKVIDRTCINLADSTFDTNVNSPTFGNILLYSVNYYVNDTVVSMKIHHTRVLEFKNDPVPVGKYAGVDWNHRYWGMSSLQKVYESISALGSVTQTTLNIMYDFVSGTYKFKNLSQLLASGNEAGLIKRLQAINMSRSTINAAILDTDEDYKKDYTSLAGLPEIIDRYMLQLSGSTGIPVTRLYGRSPAGLNATGESDTRNYYDLIEAQQRNRLTTPVRRFLRLIAIWKKLNPDVDFEFNSLYQLSEEEKADISKTEAETKKITMETIMGWGNSGMRDMKDVGNEFEMELSDIEEIPPDPEDDIPPVVDNDPNRE